MRNNNTTQSTHKEVSGLRRYGLKLPEMLSIPCGIGSGTLSACQDFGDSYRDAITTAFNPETYSKLIEDGLAIYNANGARIISEIGRADWGIDMGTFAANIYNNPGQTLAAAAVPITLGLLGKVLIKDMRLGSAETMDQKRRNKWYGPKKNIEERLRTHL